MIDSTRICFVSPKAYPLFNRSVEQVFGGAEVDLYYLSTELAKDTCFEVSCVVADYGQPAVETRENVELIRSIDFSKNSIAGAIRIWRALRKADADIYMAETASLGVQLVALFCKMYGKEFVYRTAHSYECDGTYLKKNFCMGKAFTWSLSGASVVITQNESDRTGLQNTTDISSVVIANGHRLRKVSDAVSPDSILWVGRSTSFKRPEKFIELAEHFTKEKFVMICQRATGDEYYDQLCDKAERVANIEFHKRIGFGEIDNYFQRAKFLVSTSDAEGFPNVFIQACKWAVPIVSLNVNPDGFLDKYNCGISCCGNIAKLNEAVDFVLTSQRYIELGRNGRKYVEDNHDIVKIIEQYKQIFQDT